MRFIPNGTYKIFNGARTHLCAARARLGWMRDPIVRTVAHFGREISIMADDLENRGPQDRSRINLEQAHELRYWTKELGCSENELRVIVRQDSTEAV